MSAKILSSEAMGKLAIVKVETELQANKRIAKVRTVKVDSTGFPVMSNKVMSKASSVISGAVQEALIWNKGKQVNATIISVHAEGYAMVTTVASPEPHRVSFSVFVDKTVLRAYATAEVIQQA